MPKPEHDPVDLWGSFDPPAMPLGLLPKVIEDFALVLGEHMGGDPAGLAMSALAVCAAATPDHVEVQVKRHDAAWTESARLWVALIGPPSTKKSPIINAAIGPLARIDYRLVQEWNDKFEAWKCLSKEEKASVPEPMQKRLRIGDTTVEAAQEALKGSPNGLMLVQDELSGWFGSMEKYGGSKSGSADRAFYLQSFNGGQYALNRIGRGVSLIPNLSLCLLGGIQPDAIRRVAADAVDDGLLQRLFPIVLRPASEGRDEPAPPVQSMFDMVVTMCANLGRPLAPLTFDDDAQAIRRTVEGWHHRLIASEAVARKLASHVGKLDGLFARLCVTWHAIEHCHESRLPPIIRANTARRVDEFMRRFLLPHAVCFYRGVLGLGDDHERLQAIAAYILAHRLLSVCNRDVQRGDKAMRGIAHRDIRPLLEQLSALNWLDPMPGRTPQSEPVWSVNTRVHILYAERAEREKKRRDEAKAAMGKLFGRG